MSDVSISIGTEGSQISDSPVTIGDVVGSNHGGHGLEYLTLKVSELSARVNDIEKLLGGNLGIPGLTQQLLSVKEMTHEIKQELMEIRLSEATKVPYITYLFFTLSVGALSASVLITAFGMWR